MHATVLIVATSLNLLLNSEKHPFNWAIEAGAQENNMHWLTLRILQLQYTQLIEKEPKKKSFTSEINS